ncbi:tRNA (guanosine(18)-2'-O)-methyltransferase TrmH [Wenzhouxiangella sp. AB-CW3]|uniref:tRNA (guanosine(18)-2'-O)-methyltransferase TrmH n=1 Tax=Wenzhouxiangella sp. AB-CW3 TaxID=2771012 RepID=UPI00168BD359|nr:tRNA (guanosine(18)-2'-O)-methyltransferase TrmH [Wenzhouxiangella sp. AB-CW3]QOC22423.1 tRNA (guanosine(18)-2'-O)-methyltransferase TrmH [Wenzhouxiangella sp. AB-CW3]
MTPERQHRIREVAARRQPDLTVFMERVHKPHNVAAILRTCDAVGVMQAHAVPPTGGIPPLNHTAQGAQRWVELKRHREAVSGLRELRSAGMALYAAHFSEGAVDFRQPDYTRPTAIVVGTERFGVSSEALAECDGEIVIPMLGMTQSLNVSVATALILYEAQRQRQAAGMYHPRGTDKEPCRGLIERWTARELARRRQPPPED